MATWQSLGLITPEIGGWQTFENPSIGGETFRVGFFGLGINADSRPWRTFAVLDGLYFAGSEVMSGSSVPVWPSSLKEVIYLPIPPEFKQAGWVLRSIRVRKFSKYRNGRISEPKWGIEIEEFFP